MGEGFRRGLFGAMAAASLEACDPAISPSSEASHSSSTEAAEVDPVFEKRSNEIEKALRDDSSISSILSRPVAQDLEHHVKAREELKAAITAKMREEDSNFVFSPFATANGMDKARYHATHQVVHAFDDAFIVPFVDRTYGDAKKIGQKRHDLFVAQWRHGYFYQYETQKALAEDKGGDEPISTLMPETGSSWLLKASDEEIDQSYADSAKMWNDLGK